MSEVKNTGKTVSVTYNEQEERYDIALSKKLILKAKEKFEFDTGLQVRSTNHMEDAVVSGFVNTDDQMLFIMTSEFRSNENIKLVGYYAGEEDLTLTKGTVIAKVGFYHNCNCNEELYAPPKEEVMNHVVYNDGSICIHSIDGKERIIEHVIEPDGSHSYKIVLQEEGNEENHG